MPEVRWEADHDEVWAHCVAGLNDLTSQAGAGQQVAAALASSDPVVRMRAISLVFGLAGQSQSAMQAVQQSGIQHDMKAQHAVRKCCSIGVLGRVHAL